jgi:hypothetical protein
LEILEYCDLYGIIQREQYFIDLLKPQYNILHVAGSSLGYLHSADTKKKISDTLIANHPIAQCVEILDTETNITSSYKSILQAAKILQVSRNSLSYYINKKKENNNIKPYRNRYVVNLKRDYHSYSTTFFSQRRLFLPIERSSIGLRQYSSESNFDRSNQFAYYLAGLIEAQDNSIIVPTSERSKKGKLIYPSIKLSFDSKDIPLCVLLQKKLITGSISKKRGANAYVLSFSSKECIIFIVSLINGKMRTPKINALYGLIDWLNNKKSQNSIIHKLPQNSEPLGSNSWLSGFIEGDAHFSVRATLPNKKINYPKVECRIELVQRQIYHNGLSNYNFMADIATFLDSSVNEIRTSSNHPQFRIRTISLKSNEILINYLEKYPLFSTKYLDYKD